MLVLDGLEIGRDHFLNQLTERRSVGPAEFFLCGTDHAMMASDKDTCVVEFKHNCNRNRERHWGLQGCYRTAGESKIHPRLNLGATLFRGSRSRDGVPMNNNPNLAAEQIEQDRDPLVIDHILEEP